MYQNWFSASIQANQRHEEDMQWAAAQRRAKEAQRAARESGERGQTDRTGYRRLLLNLQTGVVRLMSLLF